MACVTAFAVKDCDYGDDLKLGLLQRRAKCCARSCFALENLHEPDVYMYKQTHPTEYLVPRLSSTDRLKAASPNILIDIFARRQSLVPSVSTASRCLLASNLNRTCYQVPPHCSQPTSSCHIIAPCACKVLYLPYGRVGIPCVVAGANPNGRDQALKSLHRLAFRVACCA